MKNLIKLLIGVVLVTVIGCKKDNSVISKKIASNLHLARSINNDTGEIVGEGKSFIIMNDGWVKAMLDLSSHFITDENELMIHLDWIDLEGKSIYKKMQILTKDKPKIYSSISIAPSLRDSGTYSLNIYMFRELVVTKKFNLVVAPKTAQEKITLTTRANRKTATYSDKELRFPVMKGKWVKATISLNNIKTVKNQNLLYQFNWLDKENQIFYKKRFTINTDTIKSLDCSLEIAPEKRALGQYKVQVLLFGEVVVEKNFELIPALDATKIKSEISFCERVKKSKRVSVGTTFTIKKKNKVVALFDIENALVFGAQELNFKVVWVGLDGKPFYTKRFNSIPKSNDKTIKSVISIPPKKRKPGEYKVQLYLFNTLISESTFQLQKKTAFFVKKKTRASILFYSDINKTTKKKTGTGTQFVIKDKAKVRAFVTVKNSEMYGKMTELKFRFDWVGRNNKVFYSKKIEALPFETSTGLKSAISIPPKKRKPGKYKLRVYLFGNLISEKKFTLIN